MLLKSSSAIDSISPQPQPRPPRLTPSQLVNLIDDMAFFNPSRSPPPAPSRKNRISRPKDDVDDFLSSDLELSFASTMSLNSPSGSRAPSPIPMDISPAQPKGLHTHLAPPAPRFFGRELLNGNLSPASTGSVDTKSSSRGRQRAALPAQWMVTAQNSSKDEPSQSVFSVPEILAVPSPGDAMDVDMMSSSPSAPAALTNPTPSIPSNPAANASYSNLFFGAASPEPSPAPAPKKRRSLSPEPNQSASSSDPASSPSQHKFTRAATVGAGAPLFKKKPTLDYNAPSSKRIPPRRSALSALVAPSTHDLYSQTAHPVGCSSGPLSAPLPPPPVRRAFSAMVPPTSHVDPSSDDVSDMQNSSPAAAYARRHHARTIRRCDGSDELRPLNSAGSLGKRDREEFQDSEKVKGCSPRGLAGFGVKEVENKILPCHRVSEDGLVRISSDTLQDLLDGAYSSQVSGFTVVDCRFDYEYDGGHIPGAVNLNTTDAIEEYFLGAQRPDPCESGDAAVKTVLVFHCEFSVKRAPTFAKHLRSKDRAMNGRVYPKVCYPEMYILEGGYCQFFKDYPLQCEPRGYVQMDDPAHTHTRDTDLNNFRRGKWNRTQSYTYGQTASSAPGFPSLASGVGAPAPTSREHRNTAPSGVPSGGGTMFAAANAARGRRTGGVTAQGLCTLDEDASSSSHEDGESPDVHDSPCPPPSKAPSRPGLLGKTKMGRNALDRAASYGPTTSMRR